jgi:hypothetical protein
MERLPVIYDVKRDYYLSKQKKYKKVFLSVLVVILLFLVYFFLFNSISIQIDFTFKDVKTFKDAKSRYLDYYSQIENDKDIEIPAKNLQRVKVDSLFLLKSLDLLRNKRNEIYNSSSSFSDKLNNAQFLLEEFQTNRVNLTSPIILFDKIKAEVKLIEVDLKYFQFEHKWATRKDLLQTYVVKEISKRASHSLTSLGQETEVKYQNIQIIDSTIKQMDLDLREIIYNLKIDRQYVGLLGDRRFFGTGKWSIKLNKNDMNVIEVMLVEDEYNDVILR